MLVDDLDHELVAIGESGIVAGPVETAPGRYRKAVVEVPEGSMIQLGETLSAG